jgi:hypothetical protein
LDIYIILFTKEVAMMEKIDYKKRLKHLYAPSNKVVNLAAVPLMNFLIIEGQDACNGGQSFRDASEALIRLSYTIKFLVKKSDLELDYIAMPLEALWNTVDLKGLNPSEREDINWTLCIMQPDYVTPEIVEEGLEKTRKKKEMPFLDKVEFCTLNEGLCAQLMHLGPYSEEGESIDKLQAYLEVNGYDTIGRFHEIYLGDPRRAKPENLKTIIRQPIVKRT